MSFTVAFGEENLLFALEEGQASVQAETIAELIRKEKSVVKGCISRSGNIVMRVVSCVSNGNYKFVNYEFIAEQGKSLR